VIGQRWKLLFTVLLVSSGASMAQTVNLSLSSASATAGSTVSLNLSLSSSGTQPAALQWTLNPPRGAQSVTAAIGSAASFAGKSISCANNICVVSAINATPIGNGVVAVLSITLWAIASGNVPIQISGGVSLVCHTDCHSCDGEWWNDHRNPRDHGVIDSNVGDAIRIPNTAVLRNSVRQFKHGGSMVMVNE